MYFSPVTVSRFPQPQSASLRFGDTTKTSLHQTASGRQRHINHLSLLFRDGDAFFDFASIITSRFPQGAPILCYASSDGSEPFTIGMTLIDQVGLAKAKCLYPISCFDLQNRIMDKARQGIIEYREYDAYSFANPKEEALTRHFLPTKLPKCTNARSYYRVHPDLADYVHSFQQGDLREDAKQFKFQHPVVLFFRNAWYYPQAVTDQEYSQKLVQQEALARLLFKKLPPGSLLIVGEEENLYRFPVTDKLKRAGFKPVPCPPTYYEFVFEKPR